MKLPNIKRVLREDLGAGVPSWVEGLIGPLNTFMEAVYQTLNKNVTFSENIASFIIELTIKTDGAGAFAPMSFLNQIKIRPKNLIIGQVYVKDTFLPVATSGIAWNTDGTNVTVYEIGGLGNLTTYVVRLVIF